MKKQLLIIPIIFILVGCKSTAFTNETTTTRETIKVLETNAVEETATVKEIADQLESTTVVVVETTQPETTKIVEEPKSKVEVNIGGAEVEFTEEELKEPEIDFAKLQEELAKKQQELAEQQALQAQAAAQAQTQQAAQAQSKQGTDKNGHPYLAPGAQYTWGADGPIEAPADGKHVALKDPITGDNWNYLPSNQQWVNSAVSKAEQHEAFRKSMEGTRKLTDEESRRVAEALARGMRGD